jgi:dGTP triphosphohydrolase
MQSFEERSNVESNKMFQRLAEKTQVLMPYNGEKEVTRNRLTHSYEVATSSQMMAEGIAHHLSNDSIHYSGNQIDYQSNIFNISLLHDIGHPPFGHNGASFISETFKNLGLKEGFDDNNNNLVVIDKNDIQISDHTKASLIKYPNNLYDNQLHYKDMLKENCAIDHDYFLSVFNLDLVDQERTIACQIMDEADRNSYVCSDLSDYLCLGNSLDHDEFHDLVDLQNFSGAALEWVSELVQVVGSPSKTAVKSYFNKMKNKFNCNYTLTSKGIESVDSDLLKLREFLNSLCHKYYINSEMVVGKREYQLNLLDNFIQSIIDNEFYPSETYSENIEQASSEKDKLRYIRDMVSEVSDWYVVQANLVLRKKK